VDPVWIRLGLIPAELEDRVRSLHAIPSVALAEQLNGIYTYQKADAKFPLKKIT